LRTLLPPRRFLGASRGAGNALAAFTGGGSWNFSIFFSISSLKKRNVKVNSIQKNKNKKLDV